MARLGEAGERWLDGLPATVADLATRWSLELGRSLPGGSASYVVAARTADGVEVVVKVALPEFGFADQVAMLRRADGRGYVRLLAEDSTGNAVLLERLYGSLDRSGRPVEDQLRILADTLALAWRPATGPVVDKAAGLTALILDAWERTGRPCPESVIDQAVAYAERRSGDPGEPMLVHGDPHPANLLAVAAPRPGAETGFCFVDPDGFVADRAYDLGVVLRDWSSRLTGDDARSVAERYCRLLADHTGVDATRIWEWGFVERVSTGLYVLDRVGSPAMARPFLESAERLLDRG